MSFISFKNPGCPEILDFKLPNFCACVNILIIFWKKYGYQLCHNHLIIEFFSPRANKFGGGFFNEKNRSHY